MADEARKYYVDLFKSCTNELSALAVFNMVKSLLDSEYELKKQQDFIEIAECYKEARGGDV